MTPSLANFLGSLFWGTAVVHLAFLVTAAFAITVALIFVSKLDPINRD